MNELLNKLCKYLECYELNQVSIQQMFCYILNSQCQHLVPISLVSSPNIQIHLCTCLRALEGHNGIQMKQYLEHEHQFYLQIFHAYDFNILLNEVFKDRIQYTFEFIEFSNLINTQNKDLYPDYHERTRETIDLQFFAIGKTVDILMAKLQLNKLSFLQKRHCIIHFLRI